MQCFGIGIGIGKICNFSTEGGEVWVVWEGIFARNTMQTALQIWYWYWKNWYWKNWYWEIFITHKMRREAGICARNMMLCSILAFNICSSWQPLANQHISNIEFFCVLACLMAIHPYFAPFHAHICLKYHSLLPFYISRKSISVKISKSSHSLPLSLPNQHG